MLCWYREGICCSVLTTAQSWGLYLFTVDHDRYWQSCDAGERLGSTRVWAGASVSQCRPPALASCGLARVPSVGGAANKCTHMLHAGPGAHTMTCQASFGLLNADTPWHLVSIQTSRRLETLCRIDFYLFAVMTVWLCEIQLYDLQLWS